MPLCRPFTCCICYTIICTAPSVSVILPWCNVNCHFSMHNLQYQFYALLFASFLSAEYRMYLAHRSNIAQTKAVVSSPKVKVGGATSIVLKCWYLQQYDVFHKVPTLIIPVIIFLLLFIFETLCFSCTQCTERCSRWSILHLHTHIGTSRASKFQLYRSG